ncbi:hypothetical protein TeGR_g13774 [Tetraparma gracilis]|uniref:G-protein coupled receptors family 2 profile 2 domain-containing protein n=1 Tax=Tetraparma gracilis TaxID=2962635 RepID=A0ABQ6MEL3_9STRA|nr:hypothetical protein TeGR_g13774 [Tetraparma gracilis]
MPTSSTSLYLHNHGTFIFVTVCLVVPAVLVGFTWAQGMFGYSKDFGEDWCWIATDGSSGSSNKVLFYRLVGGKFVEFFSVIVIIITYIQVVGKLRRMQRRSSEPGTSARAGGRALSFSSPSSPES